MTEDLPSEPIEYQFGDTRVAILSSKPPGRPGTRTHIFRLRRMGLVRIYRMEVEDSETGQLVGQDLAAYLLVHARQRSLVVAFPDPFASQ